MQVVIKTSMKIFQSKVIKGLRLVITFLRIDFSSANVIIHQEDRWETGDYAYLTITILDYQKFSVQFSSIRNHRMFRVEHCNPHHAFSVSMACILFIQIWIRKIVLMNYQVQMSQDEWYLISYKVNKKSKMNNVWWVTKCTFLLTNGFLWTAACKHT